MCLTYGARLEHAIPDSVKSALPTDQHGLLHSGYFLSDFSGTVLLANAINSITESSLNQHKLQNSACL